MQIHRIFPLVWLLIPLSVMLSGCSTDFDVYAPEKEIRVAYCVLNPSENAQYIRVAKAFQFEGDAYAFAQDNDLSLRDLDIRISGNGIVYHAFAIDSFPKVNGIFYPWHTIYKFYTDSLGAGREKLASGKTYTIEIGTPESETYLVAQTTIPPLPRIQGSLSIQSGGGSSQCLPKIYLENAFPVTWVRAANTDNELRIWLNYESAGAPRTILYGFVPIENPNENRADVGSISFPPRSLLYFFNDRMLEPGPFTYDTQDSCIFNSSSGLEFPQSLVFEITAIDSFLSQYLLANNPAVLDLTGTKPEFTNFTGNIEVAGIFGSINTDRKSAILSSCGEWLLGLNGRTQPNLCPPL
jgi:Domain of unknown function (DUF4249)